MNKKKLGTIVQEYGVLLAVIVPMFNMYSEIA